MGLQLTIPFTMMSNGAVSTESDPSIQIQQRVEAIISTELGQRVMRANFGLPLSELLFSPDNSLTADRLLTQVEQQLDTYEPGLKVISVTPDVTQANDGVAGVNVVYQPVLAASTTSALSNVVTIEVGGTVIKNNSIGSGA